MNVQEIKQYLVDNKDTTEVAELLNSFTVEPTLEVFKEKVLTDADFKSFMDSEKDKHYAKALDTWKQNNLKTIVDEKVKELYPQDDPKDLELKQLKRDMEELRNERTRERMTNLALKKANELNVPTDLVDFFVANDEENTIANIERFNKTYTEGIQSTLKKKLEGNGDVVPRGTNLNDVTTKDFNDMSYTERNELYKENKGLYDELTEKEK